MLTVLITGAHTFADLVQDWSIWNSLHRTKPDIILVEHDFATDVLASADDAKRIQWVGPHAHFCSVPVQCACEFFATTGRGLVDCPGLGHTLDDINGAISDADRVPEREADITETAEPEPAPFRVTTAHKSAKPTKKPATVTKKKR